MANSSKFYQLYYFPVFTAIQKYIPSYVRPNYITTLCFVIFNSIYWTNLYLNPFILSFSFIMYWLLDNLDGIHARNTNQLSLTGEILDHCSDAFNSQFIYTIILDVLKAKEFMRLFYYKLILFLCTTSFVITHVVYMHTYNKSDTVKLELGYEYFTIDEALLLCAMSPIVTFLNIPTIYLWLISVITIIGTIIHIINNLLKIRKQINFIQLIMLFGTGLLHFFNVNLLIIAIINALYVLYLIIVKQNKK